MRREVLNVLQMTLEQYEKQLDKDHESKFPSPVLDGQNLLFNNRMTAY